VKAAVSLRLPAALPAATPPTTPPRAPESVRLPGGSAHRGRGAHHVRDARSASRGTSRADRNVVRATVDPGAPSQGSARTPTAGTDRRGKSASRHSEGAQKREALIGARVASQEPGWFARMTTSRSRLEGRPERGWRMRFASAGSVRRGPLEGADRATHSAASLRTRSAGRGGPQRSDR
jgi:hypothetical protein